MSEYTELQKPINNILRQLDITFIHYEKGRNKNRTHRGGIPDLIFWKNRKCFACELKVDGNRLTVDQKEFLYRLMKEDVKCYVVTSIAGFIDILKENGVIKE